MTMRLWNRKNGLLSKVRIVIRMPLLVCTAGALLIFWISDEQREGLLAERRAMLSRLAALGTAHMRSDVPPLTRSARFLGRDVSWPAEITRSTPPSFHSDVRPDPWRQIEDARVEQERNPGEFPIQGVRLGPPTGADAPRRALTTTETLHRDDGGALLELAYGFPESSMGVDVEASHRRPAAVVAFGLPVLAGLLLLLLHRLRFPFLRLNAAARAIREGRYHSAMPGTTDSDVSTVINALGNSQEGVERRDCEVGQLAAEVERSSAFADRVIETIPEAILVVAPDGSIVRVNAHAGRVFGYSEEELLGLRVENLLPERYRNVHVAMRNGFAGETAPRLMGKNRELLALRKDGAEFPVEVGLGPMTIGKVQYVIVALADISQRKRIEAEVVALNAKLAERLGASTFKLQVTEEALQARTEELHATLRMLSGAERRKSEEERRRLSRELHDEIGQALTALRLNLELVRRKYNGPGAEAPLHNALRITEDIARGVRAIVHELRPPQLDDLGLVAALRWHLDQVRRTSLVAAVLTENLRSTRLPPETELACFRIVQESITNVLRHASANEITVEVDYAPQRLEIVISDDGLGFDVAIDGLDASSRGHLGLLGMHERAIGLGGTLRVESTPGRGCRVVVSIPLAAPGEGAS